jgi:phage portal protein BeeE
MTQIFYDGAKAIPLQQLPPEAWTYHDEETESSTHAIYAAVAFLYRAIDVRANALSGLPWAILRGDTELWSSDEPDMPDTMQPFADIQDLLWQTEMALCLGSRAYWHKERNRTSVLSVRWLKPSSMFPVWKNVGLTGFERRVGTQVYPLPVEDVVYVWLRGQGETEPRPAPAVAALAAANVISNTDKFAAAFFERGAIKASILNIDEQTSDADRSAIKSWWKRIFSGINNAHASEVIRGPITVTNIGEGIQELSSASLTQEKREDIATALGVPHSFILSNAANYATAQQDELNFYNTTILPEAAQIERQLNQQLFEEMGYQFQFRPQEMSVFQEDEEQRAASLAQLVGAGVPLPVAMQMLGFTLPDGIEYDDLEPEPEPEPPPPVIVQPPPEPDEERMTEIRTFRRWADKRKQPDVDNFKSELLTRADKLALLEDGTADDAPFPVGWDNYP